MLVIIIFYSSIFCALFVICQLLLDIIDDFFIIVCVKNYKKNIMTKKLIVSNQNLTKPGYSAMNYKHFAAFPFHDFLNYDTIIFVYFASLSTQYMNIISGVRSMVKDTRVLASDVKDCKADFKEEIGITFSKERLNFISHIAD